MVSDSLEDLLFEVGGDGDGGAVLKLKITAVSLEILIHIIQVNKM
jgi:hypothetical protein